MSYGIIFANQMEYHEAHEDHEEIRKVNNRLQLKMLWEKYSCKNLLLLLP